jgi:hypothetical protein
MNCKDHHSTPENNTHPIYPLRWILPLIFSVLFLAPLFPEQSLLSSTMATAKPHFSIPGLHALQQTFKKRRRGKKSRDDSDTVMPPPGFEKAPPLPVRNPYHLKIQKLKQSFGILKASIDTRAHPPLPTRNPLHRASAAKQAKQQEVIVKGPSLPPLPERKPFLRLKRKTPKEKMRSKTANLSPALLKPTAPDTKPILHPSKVKEPDWSPDIIKEALKQCVTLGITITPLAPIKQGRCGNPAPVLLPDIGKTTISPAATLSCPMVANLHRWFNQSVQPLAQKYFGKKVKKIRNVSSYVCRNRYGDTKTRISEHAYANALDIASFELQGGEKISVLNNWDSQGDEKNKKSIFLHELHKSACNLFGTVLGPDANAAHKDHFHLDNAPRRRSNYCR